MEAPTHAVQEALSCERGAQKTNETYRQTFIFVAPTERLYQIHKFQKVGCLPLSKVQIKRGIK